jgi:hypothetical protein
MKEIKTKEKNNGGSDCKIKVFTLLRYVTRSSDFISITNQIHEFEPKTEPKV